LAGVIVVVSIYLWYVLGGAGRTVRTRNGR